MINDNDLNILNIQIDLVDAIRKNNLSLVKENVKLLNDLYDPNISIVTVSANLNFGTLLQETNYNDSALYVLNNLNCLRHKERLLWFYNIHILEKNNDINSIRDFIELSITFENLKIDYILNTLIRLTTKYQFFDLLKEIKNILNENVVKANG